MTLAIQKLSTPSRNGHTSLRVHGADREYIRRPDQKLAAEVEFLIRCRDAGVRQNFSVFVTRSCLDQNRRHSMIRARSSPRQHTFGKGDAHRWRNILRHGTRRADRHAPRINAPVRRGDDDQ